MKYVPIFYTFYPMSVQLLILHTNSIWNTFVNKVLAEFIWQISILQKTKGQNYLPTKTLKSLNITHNNNMM